ncbi:protein kinase [Sphaerisporangium sp. NBC_01403]|uniref:serine/threonine protein kinase n=1 Tax=Sphaerisporangium sp. NBC_01403 TaxID=2903599 RepID=UPI003246F279
MPDVQPLEPSDPVRLGAFRIVGRIGEGGQGVVYLGETDSGGLVAVKLFHARLGHDPALADSFMRELDVAKRVARFCTAQVLDSGMTGSRPYIVSEYVPGPSLSEVVAAQGPRSGSALERLAIGTATALVSLHDAGIIHRDLKPHNVLIGPDGPRVIDFGIARALAGTSTVTSQVVGTPAYMAPEQLTAGEVGRALDVFAWASTIAYAATGRPPFGNDSIPAIINRILNQDPDLGETEEPLRGLLAECLSKDPSRRPAAPRILDRLVRGTGDASAVAPSGLPGALAVPRAGDDPASTGAGSSGRSTTPGALGPGNGGGASGVDPAKRRQGRRLAVVSIVVAVAISGVIAALFTMLPEQRVSALKSGTVRSSQAGAATATPTEEPADPGSETPAASTVSPALSHTTTPSAGVRPVRRSKTGTPTREPSSSSKPAPTRVEPTATEPPPSGTSSPKPPLPKLTELGPGHFTAYCQSLGWEWDEYRETPKPGSYCIKRKGDETMYLSAGRRDAGCQWRYKTPKAFHRFKGKSNWCYIYR